MQKRIKRRVTAREQTFFAVCQPGVKNLCLKELSDLGINPGGIRVKKGGIEFSGKVSDCYRANLHLRSPSRILMRICRFRAETFAEFEKKAGKVDWDLYVSSNATVEYTVSCAKSRLYHTGAVEERLSRVVSAKAGRERRTAGDQAGAPSAGLHVRAEKDRFEISIDSSGDLLFKRGIKEDVGKAPIRENLAGAVLSWAGFGCDDLLADPMCGSGTFSMEAAMIKKRIPPGYFRRFAFEDWPCFSGAQFAHMKKKAREEIVSASEKSIFAFDIDETVLAPFGDNISRFGFEDVIHVKKKDFFTLTCVDFNCKKGVIVINPPYGKRIRAKNETGSFFMEIGNKLKKDFSGWRAGVVVPDKSAAASLALNGRLTRFFHGGLDVFAVTGKV